MTNSVPRRPLFSPRHDLPDADALGEHWKKHPSDYYADCALGRLIASAEEADTQTRQNTLREAQVYATLSLRDALLEVRATATELTQQLIEHLPKEQ